MEGEWVDWGGGGGRKNQNTLNPQIRKVLDRKAFCDSCTLWNEDLKNAYKPALTGLKAIPAIRN